MSQGVEKKEQGLFFTQDDIDAALQAVDTPESHTDLDDMEALLLDETDMIDPDSDDSEYFGLLSQEDIEALLHGDIAVSEGDDDAHEEIDSLLATAVLDDDIASPAANELSVEESIQKTAADVNEQAETVNKETPATRSETPEGSDSISQDDIDRLLMSAIDDSEEDEGYDLQAVTAAPEGDGAVSQNDIDWLLESDSDQNDADTETDVGNKPIENQESDAARNDNGGMVSQADLERLMGEVVPEADAEGTSPKSDGSPQEHISQSDINKLLKESLEEEDLPDEEEAEPDPIDEPENAEPVILAEDEEVAEPPPSAPEHPPVPSSRKKAAGRFKRKRLLVSVAAAVVLILAVSIMMMPSGRKETVFQPKVLTFSVPQPDDAGQSALPVSGKSVRLNGFVILAPPNSAAVTYLTGDLLLALSDASLVDLIKENEAYVRDIVYGTINRELMTRDISTIDEISLELAIRKELGRVIPRGAIERIDFEGFSLA